VTGENGNKVNGNGNNQDVGDGIGNESGKQQRGQGQWRQGQWQQQ
jgi:hypothetical protein